MDVSVIIPAYNEEMYIWKTLNALPKGAEKIVVANGCTDRTTEMAKGLAKIVVTKKRGVSMARNLGAKGASKNILVFLDADIVVAPDTIRKIEESKLDVGVCRARPDVDEWFPKLLMMLKNFVNRFGFSTGLIFCTKKMFEDVGGFREDLDTGEDGLFLRTAKKKGKFGVVDTYVVNSMRRFEKLGYWKVMGFWVKHFFHRSRDKYLAVR